MIGQRQKNRPEQGELAFPAESRSEAPKTDGKGTETLVAKRRPESLAETERLMQKRWDPTFSEHSHGFRPGRSARQAVRQAQQYIAEGRRWVVDLDLEKFFDQVNHDRLIVAVAKRVADRRMLQLIGAFLKAGVLEELDRELEGARSPFCTLRRRWQHLRGQRASGTAGDEERNALHHGTTQTQGESGQERRGPTGAEEVSRI
jgi:hypothetical protein